MEFKGSPGVWEYMKYHGQYSVGTLSANPHCVAALIRDQADAKLISAAPELLALLQELFKIGVVYDSAIEESDEGRGFLAWEADARAAIRKALGEEAKKDH